MVVIPSKNPFFSFILTLIFRVKLGFHKPTGTYVAIKLAKKEKNESNERTLRNEFFFLKEIKHPNLINLIDFSLGAEYRKKNGVIQKSMYTVLELAQGGPLFDYLAFTGKFSEDTARTFFSQLISGFSFFHVFGHFFKKFFLKKKIKIWLFFNLETKILGFFGFFF